MLFDSGGLTEAHRCSIQGDFVNQVLRNSLDFDLPHLLDQLSSSFQAHCDTFKTDRYLDLDRVVFDQAEKINMHDAIGHRVVLN